MSEIRPMERTGESANIAFYHERGPKLDVPHIWCEVLCGVPFRRRADRRLERDPDRPISFEFRVVRQGEGEIGTFTYTPRTQPPPSPLPARTVTRLVRDYLA